nr:hypothetical protein [Bacteroidota bacterium]
MIEIKENLKKMAKVNRGLCTTCNNAPTCLFFLGNGSRIVWYCETFDNYVSFQESIPKTEKMIIPKTEDPGKSVFEGLCTNCAHCSTCNFPKHEGGVWHCEEYE